MPPVWKPSKLTITLILLVGAVLAVVAFLAGFLPRQQRNNQIYAEAQEQQQALPRVGVVEVGTSTRKEGLQLPGSLQAINESPILARAEGYLARRLVDIGDHVKAGQPLAEIEAPELDAQVRQARANVGQTQSVAEQAAANLEQGKTDAELARITAERWTKLAAEGVVSKQDEDQYRAQYKSRQANVNALEKAVSAQRSSIAVAEANVARLERMQSYRTVRAPFDGVITLRNIDAGTLVNEGTTLLFRIAQTDTLRAYVNVPQLHASSIRPGQSATLTVPNLPGREFTGTVSRSAGSLDPVTRTMLVEINVPNRGGFLLPGMYAQIDLGNAMQGDAIVIPSEALIVRADGVQVAVVRPDRTIHLQKIQVGRDYGDRVEVASGLKAGEKVIANPGDIAREGLKVDPVPVAK